MTLSGNGNGSFSEAAYQTILATVLDGFWVIGPGGKLLDCNAEACRMLGYSREELLGLSVIDIDAFESPEEVEARMREIRERGGLRFKAVHRRKDGVHLDVEVSVHFSPRQGGFYAVFVRDLSRQVRLESDLRLERDFTRRYLEVASVMFVVLNREGGIELVNRHGCQVLGYTEAELLGRDWFETVIPEDEAPGLRGVFARLLAGEGEELSTYQNRVRTRDGACRLIAWSNNFVRDNQGRVERVISCGRDITEERRAEEQLIEERNKLEAVMTALNDGVTLQDKDFTILYQNRKHQEMQGPHQGEPCYRAYQRRDSICPGCVLAKTFADGQVHRREVIAPDKDGGVTHLEVIACPVLDAQGGIVAGIEAVRDISERKKLELEAQRARNLESLGVFAGGLAHDFNNLLAAILGNLSLAQHQRQEGLDIGPLFSAMESACQRAQQLTRQLLTFAKGGAPVIDITSITGIVRHSTGFFLAGSKVRLTMEMPDDLWPVEVDGGQISQVVQNLAQNAEQAMPEGGVLRVRAENVNLAEPVSGLPLTPGRYVKLTFADNGGGISPENLPRVFDPYFTTKEKGSGLGLAVSFSIVVKNRGHIAVESALGRGATFTLWLPAASRETRVAAAPAPAAAVGNAAVRPGRILVMDDEAMIRDLAIAMFTTLGHSVTTVRDGVELLAEYRAARAAGRPYDLVVMDLTIPGGLGGKEAMVRLLELDPQALAIVSSGYSDDPVVANYLDYGFKAVLDKPFTLRELRAVLSRLLAR
ncbi:MAG: PAS domain S-box protein [Desulfobacteraceae bacterium]|nr:PAS domain S-box protein [Desulfobacteraceae bacterium]